MEAGNDPVGTELGAWSTLMLAVSIDSLTYDKFQTQQGRRATVGAREVPRSVCYSKSYCYDYRILLKVRMHAHLS